MASTESVRVGLPTKTEVDVEPFSEFYRREYLRVVGVAYAITGDRSAAEDVTQDAFIAAHKRWDRIGRYEFPGGWVCRAATNGAISRRRRVLSESRAVGRVAQRLPRVRTAELSAETTELWEAVRSLPKRQAQVIVLTYLEGYTIPEVADILGCRVTTAKTHMRRARQALSGRLGLIEEGL
jgi:RNA polymerase sigma-70 factor (ECF subfamily)